MRWQLLWSPGLVFERLGYWARQRRRRRKLRGTLAQGLALGHIESLELLESAKSLCIRKIYDVGANVGTWTLLAKSIFPEATVEAFEPLSTRCTEFEKNTGKVDGVHLHRVALGSDNTAAVLRVTNFPDASSLLPLAAPSRTQFGLKEVSQIPVEVRRLDDYRRERELEPPDLVKVDVQGYELAVLKGATECLRHAKALIVEVSAVEYYQDQCLLHEVVGYLANCGLHLAVLGDHTPTGSSLKQMDVLFLRQGG